jgi:signal peptidase I
MTDESPPPDDTGEGRRVAGQPDPGVSRAATSDPSDPSATAQPDPVTTDAAAAEANADERAAETRADTQKAASGRPSPTRHAARLVRELVLIVAIALVASALLRAFVVQAYYVPSGSMLPEIKLQDRILVSRIGEVDRGEVVVFEDPDEWIPATEQPDPPGPARQALEWVGVLPASGHEHLVKRAVGLPGDHVVCCSDDGRLVINGQPVDESDFLFQGDGPADESSYDVVVPADHIFVLGDHRAVSGDSSRQQGQQMFVPMDNVVGRAFAVIWPASNMHVIEVPDAYDDVPDGQTPPEKGIINDPGSGAPGDK